jgi:hypothetical protein
MADIVGGVRGLWRRRVHYLISNSTCRLLFVEKKHIPSHEKRAIFALFVRHSLIFGGYFNRKGAYSVVLIE